MYSATLVSNDTIKIWDVTVVHVGAPTNMHKVLTYGKDKLNPATAQIGRFVPPAVTDMIAGPIRTAEQRKLNSTDAKLARAAQGKVPNEYVAAVFLTTGKDGDL
jgi:hypothetical protein